jgi:hypothetical protein
LTRISSRFFNISENPQQKRLARCYTPLLKSLASARKRRYITVIGSTATA